MSDSEAHASAQPDSTLRALWLALLLNGAFLFVEAGVGWWSGSLALLGDAAHMVSDVVSLAVALGAARLARRPPDPHHTFGLRRAETVGAFINGLILVLASLWIVVEAVHRVLAGAPEVAGIPVLVVGAVGLAINLGSALVLWRSEGDDLNVRGALLHMIADALGSVGAIVAALFLMAGVAIADPLVSLLIAALVVWGAWGLLREAGRVLLQLPPNGVDVKRVVRELGDLPDVINVHDLHVWTLDGQTSIVTAHLVLAPDADLEGARCAASGLLAREHGIEHATLQVERDQHVCPDEPCELTTRASGGHAHHGHAHPH